MMPTRSPRSPRPGSSAGKAPATPVDWKSRSTKSCGVGGARSLELPDYYLLVDAEALPPTLRHWYLGVLAVTAAHRIVVVGPDPVEAVGAVRELTAGRWWPQLDALLADVDRRVPDALSLGEPATGLVL